MRQLPRRGRRLIFYNKQHNSLHMDFKHKLGLEAKDKISGFAGIIVARIEHLTGCNVYWLAPTKLTTEGKKQESEAFDEERLKIIGKGIAPEEVNPKPVAGKIRKPGAEKLKSAPRGA